MSIQSKYYSEIDAAELTPGAVVRAVDIYGREGEFTIHEYQGTFPDGTAAVRASLDGACVDLFVLDIKAGA